MDPISIGLPHREPFIFVESVEKLEAGLLAECSKTTEGDTMKMNVTRRQAL